MSEPLLRLYLVSCGFSNDVGGISIVPAMRETEAVAASISGAATMQPRPELPLKHLYVREVAKEELVRLIQVIETGNVEGLPN